MNRATDSLSALQRPTWVRYGVLGFACALSLITYLDRVCFATVAPYIGKEFDLSKQQLGWLFTGKKGVGTRPPFPISAFTV